MSNIYEEALKKSTKKTVVSYKKHKNQIKTTALSVCLATLLATSILTPKANTIINDIKSYNNSLTIGSLINEGDTNKSIIANNTHRTNDGENIFYDTYGMANDILKMDASFFEVALYNTYKNMEYKNNMDDLIKQISMIVNDKKEEYSELFYKLKDVKSFEDYLKKIHCIDKDGVVSLEKYNKYGETLENIYGDLLNEEKKERLQK